METLGLGTLRARAYTDWIMDKEDLRDLFGPEGEVLSLLHAFVHDRELI